ncbi:hypothetical protein NDU88_007957 [Pleurodeles waltl]|uniref:Uncharacterized protein n=1 Tax=Pleurodeles waltl TaxID=8319 RepID=A0AAV7VV38_PLEWA|nr:hypothetical protein NDU88_007957 [Pleurodeles waltl]
MMRILIKHSEKKTIKRQVEIDKIEKSIEHLNLKEATKKNYEIMDKVLEDYQLYLCDKKLHKIKRDDLDYKEGIIYTFARKHDNLSIYCKVYSHLSILRWALFFLVSSCCV